MSDAGVPKSTGSATAGAAHRYRASVDFSNLQSFSPLSSRSARPSSMMFEGGTPLKNTQETQVYDNWLKDLSHYQKTLEEMYSASLDAHFKEELGAIEKWFRVLSEAERTAAMYSLLQQATQVQIRFFIMVLQEKARADPMSAILSPANFNKDAMSQHMTGAMQQMNIGKPAPSPGFLRPEEGPNRSISQMFPDAAAALANQRAELQRKRSLFVPGASASTPSIDLTLAKSLKDDAVKSPWTPSFRKTLDGPERPKSAEPTKTAFPRSESLSMGTPLRMARTDLNAASLPYSPFDSSGPAASWASMTNTPATAMFPTDLRQGEALQQRLAAVNQSMVADGAVQTSSPRVVLESDVRKFRRATPKSPAGDLLSSVQQDKNSSIMMYDDDGQLMSPQAVQQYASPLNGRLGASPAMPGSPLLPVFSDPRHASFSGAASPNAMRSWTMTPGSNASYMFPTSSPAMAHHAQLGPRDGSFSPDVEGKRRASATAKQMEDPTDAKLLADIPAWLRHLRLHKYTDNLKDMRWQEMVRMSNDDLAAKGVSAQGARNKLMKSFADVLEAVKSGKLKE